MEKSAKVAIVVLTFNQKNFTLNCLRSLDSCSYENFYIIVVDNHSKDNTIEEIRTHYPDVHIVENQQNAGVAGGRNIGITYADSVLGYDYLLLIDNDTTVEVDFLQAMVRCLDRDEKLGVVAPKIFLMDENRILDQAGGSVVNFFTGSTAKRGYGEEDAGQYDDIVDVNCLPSGACSLSRKSTLKACGGLDEVFSPYGFEDLDYSLRAKKLGYGLAYVPESVIYHKGNKTGFNSYTEQYTSIKGKHLKTFMKRHASFLEITCFSIMLPLLGCRTMLREARKGNVKAAYRMIRSYLSN